MRRRVKQMGIISVTYSRRKAVKAEDNMLRSKKNWLFMYIHTIYVYARNMH